MIRSGLNIFGCHLYLAVGTSVAKCNFDVHDIATTKIDENAMVSGAWPKYTQDNRTSQYHFGRK